MTTPGVRASDLNRCPERRPTPEHYRENGVCRCFPDVVADLLVRARAFLVEMRVAGVTGTVVIEWGDRTLLDVVID